MVDFVRYFSRLGVWLDTWKVIYNEENNDSMTMLKNWNYRTKLLG